MQTRIASATPIDFLIGFVSGMLIIPMNIYQNVKGIFYNELGHLPGADLR